MPNFGALLYIFLKEATKSRFMMSTLMTFVATTSFLAGPGPERVEVPIANRPETFTGAVGTFTVTARAEPVTLRVDQPFQYVLQVTGDGDLSGTTAPALERQPGFASDFELIGRPTERSVPGGKEFSYSLRPRSTAVTRIPPIRFSFYNPLLGRFETTIARSIPLVVSPAERLTPAAIESPPISHAAERPVDNTLTASILCSVLIATIAAAGIIGTVLFRQRRRAGDALVDERTIPRGWKEPRRSDGRLHDRVIAKPKRFSPTPVSSGPARQRKSEPAIERLERLLELTPGRQTSEEMLQAVRQRGIEEVTLLGLAEALRRYDRARFGRSIGPEEDAEAFRALSRHVDEVIVAMNARD